MCLPTHASAEQTRSCSSVGRRSTPLPALRAAAAWSLCVYKRARREDKSLGNAISLDVGMRRNQLRRAPGGFGKETTEDRGQASRVERRYSVTAHFQEPVNSGAKQVFFIIHQSSFFGDASFFFGFIYLLVRRFARYVKNYSRLLLCLAKCQVFLFVSHPQCEHMISPRPPPPTSPPTRPYASN